MDHYSTSWPGGYETALQKGLELASRVGYGGRFTADAVDGRLEGLGVLGDGNSAMIETVRDFGVLSLQESCDYEHVQYIIRPIAWSDCGSCLFTTR